MSLVLITVPEQTAIHERMASLRSIEEANTGHPMFMNIAVQYLRPKLTVYAKETLQSVILDLIAEKDLNLEIDPIAVS